MGTKRRPRTSASAASASSGVVWLAFMITGGRYAPMGIAARSNGPSRAPISLSPPQDAVSPAK